MTADLRARRHLGLSHKLARIQDSLEHVRREQVPNTTGLPQEIVRVLHFIHDHLFEPNLNVNTLRAGCRLRDNNISTRFRKALGMGIREYIEMLRLEAASRLLREHCLEVYLVAMAVGYCRQETFCRAFHRRFQRSPSDLRIEL